MTPLTLAYLWHIDLHCINDIPPGPFKHLWIQRPSPRFTSGPIPSLSSASSSYCASVVLISGTNNMSSFSCRKWLKGLSASGRTDTWTPSSSSSSASYLISAFFVACKIDMQTKASSWTWLQFFNFRTRGFWVWRHNFKSESDVMQSFRTYSMLALRFSNDKSEKKKTQ